MSIPLGNLDCTHTCAQKMWVTHKYPSKPTLRQLLRPFCPMYTVFKVQPTFMVLPGTQY